MQIPASASGINHILIFTYLYKTSFFYVSWYRWRVQNQANNYCLTLGNNNCVQLRETTVESI
jgi:hypothetical protein